MAVLYLSNLPFHISEEEVVQFLELPPEAISKVQFCTNKQGKPSGDCFVAVTDHNHLQAGLAKNSQRTSGETSRRITVTESSVEEMENPNAATAARREKWDGIIKIKGFPSQSTLEHVKEFLNGLEYQEDSLIMPRNNKDESIGEAYVQFLGYSQAQSCLDRHKSMHETLSSQISVFKTSNVELRKCMVATMKANAAEMGVTQNGAMMGMQNQMMQQQMMSPTSSMPQQMNGSWPNQNLSNGGWPTQNPQQNAVNENNNGFGGPPASFGAWNKPSFGATPTSLKRPAGNPGFNNLPEKHSRNSEDQYSNRIASNTENPKIITKPLPAGAPSKHLVLCDNLPEGLTNGNIQEFFRPYRAIAVKIETDGKAMVAFKTHSDAEGAMSKDTNNLREKSVNLKLWSEKPAAIGEWGAL